MSTTLADPEKRDDPSYEESQPSQLPLVIQQMNEEQQAHLYYLAEKKAWIKATEIQDFTDEEQETIAQARKKHGEKVANQVQDRLYKRYHWDSLRWFLFGGLVDIPIQQDPKRAWDPKTNPFLKVRIRSFVWTQDEHDQTQPYKRLPDKDYLRMVAYAWIHEPLLATPKSRQMLLTWLFSAIGVHETMFRPAKTTAWISKKFDDADANLEKRVKPIAERLPSHFDPPVPSYKSGIFENKNNNSIIRAMGEEAKGLRQYTFSWVFSDEAAFQDQAGDIVQAALPTVKGGGRFSLVSSANGKEVFHGVVSEGGKIPVPAGV